MTHYSWAQSASKLDMFAQIHCKNLMNHFCEKNVHVVLCYTGLSGTALCTALMMEIYKKNKKRKNKLNYTMMYVRKENEESHGSDIEEGNWDETSLSLYEISQKKEIKFVFVDDFIDTGSTLRKMVRIIKKNTNINMTFSVCCLQSMWCNETALNTSQEKYVDDDVIGFYA